MKLRLLRILLALVALGATGAGARAEERIDLNRATRAEISALPVPAEISRAIWEYREFVDWYRDIGDLMRVEGMTPSLLDAVLPRVRVIPVPLDPEDQRKNDLFYRFEWWEGAEGADESLIELYKDLALDPVNVNEARILDLQNLQNVSPIDAVAIARHREQVGEIGNQGALRRAYGLSGWGYSNARSFLDYSSVEDDERLHGAWGLRVDTTPYFNDVEDLLRSDRDPAQGTNDNWWDRLGLDQPDPAVYQRFRIRRGRRVEAGFVTTRRLGEEDLFNTVKGYVGVHDLRLGPVTLNNFVFGSYMLSWGQGVVMENNDFRSSRKTGYNFRKRYDGVLGDASRTDEYQMRGVAGELSFGPLRMLGFYSDVDRDAIINDDGSANLLIRLTPRVPNEELERAGLRPMLDQLRDQTWGGSLRVGFAPGSWIGVSGYESRYDRFFDPKWNPTDPTDKNPLVADDNEDVFVAQDSEYAAAYKSPGKYRRVYGMDFQWVWQNLALQGEYAELDLGANPLKLGVNPSALVLNAFLQWENLSFLAVWRDYDLRFDNPFQRSFSNYERYKGTILEDYFRLEDPLYGLVYANSSQPQAERGMYFDTRYRVSEAVILGLEWDSWQRIGDMSQYYRAVGRIEYRILFPLRFKIRTKVQNREWRNLLDPSIFENIETRAELEYRLSRFDQLDLFFAVSHTQWPPRGRLQGEPIANGLNPISGNNAQPATAWGAWWTHHFESRRIKLDGAFLVYDGFLWFFEKSTFRVADGKAFRWFIEITDRFTDKFTLRFRYGHENELRNTAIDIRQFNEQVNDEIDAENVKEVRDWFRLQMDYTF
jgi:DNA uptake protein ComE-like DNA-binding protein